MASVGNSSAMKVKLWKSMESERAGHRRRAGHLAGDEAGEVAAAEVAQVRRVAEVVGRQLAVSEVPHRHAGGGAHRGLERAVARLVLDCAGGGPAGRGGGSQRGGPGGG